VNIKSSIRVIFAAMCLLLVSQSASAIDGVPPFGIDDRLTVSVAADGDQSFPETDLNETFSTAVLSFDDINGLGYCDPETLTAGPIITDDDGNQTGEMLLANRIRDNGTVFIGYGSGYIECGGANVYGGASAAGSYVAPSNLWNWYLGSGDPGNPFQWTLTFSNRQKYVGFWWSAGNDENYVQLLDESGNAILDPHFSAASLNQTLFGSANRLCIINNVVDDYCGNPNVEYQEPWRTLDYGPDATFNRGTPDEPYAFIHLRLESGFHGIRFSGNGFEFDNLTFSEEMIDFGNEEQVIGSTTAYSLATSPIIPVDPRDPSVSFPGIVLGGDAAEEPNATLCFTQVTDIAGTTAVSSENITLSLSSNGTLAPSGEPPNFVFSGTQSAVQSVSTQIRIVNSVVGRSVVTSTPVWIRVSVSPASSGGEATCATTGGEITSTVVELRPLSLTNDNQSQVSLD